MKKDRIEYLTNLYKSNKMTTGQYLDLNKEETDLIDKLMFAY